MKFDKIIEEVLTQDVSNVMSNIENDLINNDNIKSFILKVMPYSYKKENSLNLMMNSKYKELDDKEELHNNIKEIAKKYIDKIKFKINNNVIKIFVKGDKT